MYSYLPACCCVVCCHTAAAAATGVRGRVLDGKICSHGSLHLTPVFCFSAFKPDMFSMYLLAVVASHFQRRFFCIMHTLHPRYYRHARSQGGRLPAAAGPPLYFLYVSIDNILLIAQRCKCTCPLTVCLISVFCRRIHDSEEQLYCCKQSLTARNCCTLYTTVLL